MKRTQGTVLVSVLVLLVAAGHASAQNKCAANKVKAVAKKAKCLLDLEAKAAKDGTPAPADKLQKCRDKFTAAFAKAEEKPPCLTTGDTASLENTVDGFVLAATGALLICPTVAGTITVAPGASPAGYIPLDAFGIPATPIGDEEVINVGVQPFVYAGDTYTSVGITSNGYLVVGGATTTTPLPQMLPDLHLPNGVLAPFWTNLDGSDAPGILTGVLSDGVNSWFVVEWRLHDFGTVSLRTFQVWIGINGVEDISFAYNPAALPATPGFSFVVGAEDATGCRGDRLVGLPTGDLRVTSTP